MKFTGPKNHRCVDYCAPPEHCDLVHLNYDATLPYTPHVLIDEAYWHLYHVPVTHVQRAPEFDALEITGEWSKHPIMGDGRDCHIAYLIRWNTGQERLSVSEIRSLYEQRSLAKGNG